MRGCCVIAVTGCFWSMYFFFFPERAGPHLRIGRVDSEGEKWVRMKYFGEHCDLCLVTGVCILHDSRPGQG